MSHLFIDFCLFFKLLGAIIRFIVKNLLNPVDIICYNMFLQSCVIPPFIGIAVLNQISTTKTHSVQGSSMALVVVVHYHFSTFSPRRSFEAAYCRTKHRDNEWFSRCFSWRVSHNKKVRTASVMSTPIRNSIAKVAPRSDDPYFDRLFEDGAFSLLGVDYPAPSLNR